MKKIKKQYSKATKLCNEANSSCQELACLISPYIHEDIRDDINIFEQHGDGLVLEYECQNYTIESVIRAISEGYREIDLRSIPAYLDLI